MNFRSASGAHFGFNWQTSEAERKDVYDKADALINAARTQGGRILTLAHLEYQATEL